MSNTRVAVDSKETILLDVDLREVVFALSDALDLVGVSDVAHGKRVAIMAEKCARLLGYSEAEARFIFELGMLHDIGVSSSKIHRHLISEFDWENSQEHCLLGSRLLRGFSPFARMSDPVLFHHTHWQDLTALDDVAPDVAEMANLIFLVDRVDALAAAFYSGNSILRHNHTLRAHIGELSGSFFSPRLVEAFMVASESEAFWLSLEPRGIQMILQAKLLGGQRIGLSLRDLKRLSRLFARIVDAKSFYTANHSVGVARVSRLVGRRMGLDHVTCELLTVAALLHDLGKLRVPDEILEKPGSLDDQELSLMQAHSFETYQILGRIRGFEQITEWAAYHHEAPGGRGYPFHIDAEKLPLPARILRVADIFQAMVQDRPYRIGLSEAAVRSYLDKLVLCGMVDGEVVTVLEQNMTIAWRVAGGRGPREGGHTEQEGLALSAE